MPTSAAQCPRREQDAPCPHHSNAPSLYITISFFLQYLLVFYLLGVAASLPVLSLPDAPTRPTFAASFTQPRPIYRTIYRTIRQGVPGGSLLTRPRAWFRSGVADGPSVPVPGVGKFQGDYFFFHHSAGDTISNMDSDQLARVPGQLLSHLLPHLSSERLGPWTGKAPSENDQYDLVS